MSLLTEVYVQWWYLFHVAEEPLQGGHERNRLDPAVLWAAKLSMIVIKKVPFNLKLDYIQGD